MRGDATVRRVLGAFVGAFAGALVVLLVGLGPASADEPGGGVELGLSRDGVTWAPTLAEPLFDASVRWVPGDVRTERFYVRNQATSRGAMTVTVRSVRRDALLETRTLSVAARSGDGEWRAVDGPSLVPIVDADLVASGAAVPVDVRVTMDSDARNQTMVLGTDLEFTVQLADARSLPGGSGDGAAGEHGLGDSGASVAAWTVLVGALAVFTGTTLLLARRGSDEEDGDGG